MFNSEVKVNVVEPITQEWSIAKVARERTPSTWEDVFVECDKTFDHIDEQLKDKVLYPEKKYLFRALDLTKSYKVKVILLGQDLYPTLLSTGKPRAQGLSFSVSKNDPQIPPSLQNMFKEIRSSCEGTVHKHGCLISWAKQGVLLLNSALTFCPEDPEPHVQLWKHFVVTVINKVCKENDFCVAILLGAKAQKYASNMKSNVKILETSHPSGRSAHMGFLGSGIFKQCNEELEKAGLSPIDWSTY